MDRDSDEPGKTPNEVEVTLWMQRVVAELLDMPADSVEVDAPWTRFGIDSSTAVIVTDMLSEWLQRDLEPTLLYEYDTIAALAQHLAGD